MEARVGNAELCADLGHGFGTDSTDERALHGLGEDLVVLGEGDEEINGLLGADRARVAIRGQPCVRTTGQNDF